MSSSRGLKVPNMDSIDAFHNAPSRLMPPSTQMPSELPWSQPPNTSSRRARSLELPRSKPDDEQQFLLHLETSARGSLDPRQRLEGRGQLKAQSEKRGSRRQSRRSFLLQELLEETDDADKIPPAYPSGDPPLCATRSSMQIFDKFEGLAIPEDDEASSLASPYRKNRPASLFDIMSSSQRDLDAVMTIPNRSRRTRRSLDETKSETPLK